MNNRQKIWLWASAVIALIVGFIIVMSDSAAGWFLVILGITYIGVSTRIGQSRATSDPRLARWGLIGPLLLVLLSVILGAILLMK